MMDLCGVNVKNQLLIFHKNSFSNYRRRIPISNPITCCSFRLFSNSNSSSSCSQQQQQQHYRRPFLLTASSKNNNNNFSSSGNDNDGEHSIPEGNNDPPPPPPHVKLDWREFRAKLYRDELKQIADTDTHKQGEALQNSKPLGTKWAHPIPVPETGCVLVATEKLDGVRTFERTVVLLLRSGTKHPQEGPFGIVINRPLHKKIKNMKPTNHDLLTTFSDCCLHFGGPLEASMFLLKSREKLKLPGFQEVVPGLYFGARNSLDDAAGLVKKKGILKPRDFSFFVGYAGWQMDQLRDEIESDYWHVAACSSGLLSGALSDSSQGLWEEILQLMGGHYSELSRKPKQDP